MGMDGSPPQRYILVWASREFSYKDSSRERSLVGSETTSILSWTPDDTLACVLPKRRNICDMATFADHRGAGDGSRGRQGRGRKGRQENPTVQLSKRLTRALRHDAKKLGLNMRPDGFVELEELLSKPSFRGVSKQQVEGVVAACEKGRMTLASFPSGDPNAEAVTGASTQGISDDSCRLFIRANQGHSVKGVVDEEQLLARVVDAADIPVCVHGTDRRSWLSIRKEGLKCMKRTHIHFAAGLPGETGVISGMRKSCKVLIYVDVAAAMADGIAFFRSSNNVILTAGKGGTLEPRFFLRVDGVSEDASPPESKAVPRAAHVTSGKRVGSSAREKSITTTAARRAAAPTKQQPRPRSDRMLQDTGLGAGVKCDGGGGGGGGVGGGDGGGSGGGGGGKPAAESRRSEERHETFCPAGGNRSREGHI